MFTLVKPLFIILIYKAEISQSPDSLVTRIFASPCNKQGGIQLHDLYKKEEDFNLAF